MRVKLKKDQADKIGKFTAGKRYICGIDEVGRGPIAGPVVSCAIVMNEDIVEGIKDSKKLTDKKRRQLSKDIMDRAVAIGYGIVDNKRIDEINIRQATLESMRLAVENLIDKDGNSLRPDLLLIDAESIDMDIDQVSIVGGDDLVYQISCASIMAKIFRDDIMIEYDKIYPGYYFKNHKGYGTKKHFQAIDDHGITAIHRKTFLRKHFNHEDHKRPDS